jgi:XTP/dITP diphosphohydrolase
MNKLLIATHNPAKLMELKKVIKPLINRNLEIISLEDLHLNQEPEETGKTFKENALLKAKYFAVLSNLPTLADDGGLTIDSLNGEPGVKSKRWLGYDATDEELINYTLERLSDCPPSKRNAALEVCLCFYDPKTKHTLFAEEKIQGFIALKTSKKRIKGYPFRSLFIVEEFNKYYDELTDQEHEKINHRHKAAKELVKEINRLW